MVVQCPPVRASWQGPQSGQVSLVISRSQASILCRAYIQTDRALIACCPQTRPGEWPTCSLHVSCRHSCCCHYRGSKYVVVITGGGVVVVITSGKYMLLSLLMESRLLVSLLGEGLSLQG